MASSTHIAQTLLNEAHPPDIAEAVFTEKVLHKPLHLRATSPDPTFQDARAERRLQRLRKKEKGQRRQKPKPLSAKDKRISGLYDITEEAKRYEIYIPLHRMWIGYMWEILGIKGGEKAFVTAQSAGSKLASADYHGAELTVVRSRCVGMVGLAGIVLKDTKFTFQIITAKNELKSVYTCKIAKKGVLLTIRSYTKEAYRVPVRNTRAGDTARSSERKSRKPMPGQLQYYESGV